MGINLFIHYKENNLRNLFTHFIMKKTKILIALFISLVNYSFSQLKEGKFYLSPSVQPSSEVHFKYAYSYDYSIYVGQPFTFKATNVSTKRVRVKFDLVALTICGNEVKAPFDIVLDVKESIGFGNAFFDNNYIASVTKINCVESKPVEYTFKGKKLNGKNKINDVYIKNLVVNPLPDKLATKANVEPKKELTDDEKLNQAMMKQLEKDFEAEQKPKKKEPVITSNHSNQTSTSPSSSIKNGNLNSTEDYKQFVVNKLSNYSYNAKTTSMFGITTNETFKIENLYWQGNTLHIIRYHTIGVGAKQKEEIKWSFSKNEYIGIEPHEKSTTISGRKLWNLIGSYGSIMMFSEDKELIESLCRAFNYIKTNGN
jgi:hypothetical protein